VNKQIARKTFFERKILFGKEFDSVDWEILHGALWDDPRMYAIWASKQIMNTAAANNNKPWDRSNICCPSCLILPDTYGRIMSCDNAGRVETLLKSIDLLKTGWRK
jgi:hypothetical protein